MKIVIIGAGDVGFELARVLSEEKHDVFVMDQDQGALNRVIEKLAVLALLGSATSPHDLISVEVKSADILIHPELAGSSGKLYIPRELYR